jgi:arylsulfatase A-like enzyme/O-glycosyl hydrolase
MLSKLFTGLLVISLAAAVRADNVVDFNAAIDVVNNSPNVAVDTPLNTAAPLVNADGVNYFGPDIYGALNREVRGWWTVGRNEASGLRVRFNSNDFGNLVDGLFLFRVDGVQFDAANDTLNAQEIFTSQIQRLDSAVIRFVVEEAGQFYISEPSANFVTGGTGNQVDSYSIEALSAGWFNYDPSTAAGVSVIGAPASPAFTDIGFVGFTLFADAIDAGDSSVNFGVREFTVSAVAAPAATMVDGGLKHQKIEGFGASGAFYINRLIDNDHSGELADLLFQDLGLDIFRIRNLYAADTSGDPEGWALQIDDTRDTILLGEASLGRPLKILMSSWTPPNSLKSNNNAASGTLASDAGGYRYDDYATWWRDSLWYYRTYKSITPDFISIQNEPNFETTYSSCRFDPVENASYAGYNQAFEAVWQELAIDLGTAAMPKMLGPELVAFNKLDEYIDNLVNPAHAYGYAHHLYSSNVGTNPSVLNAEMQSTGNAYDYKPLFQSEYFNGDSPTEWLRKYNLAKLMHNSLTIEGVSAYLYWSLYWPFDDGQALITLPDNTSYDINPEYYAFKHYSAFIHSDWRRLETESPEAGIDLSAYINPDEDKVTVVILNKNTGAVNLEINFANLSITAGDIYRSTATLNCTNAGTFNPAAPLSIPAESITTLDLTAIPAAAPAHTNILMICIDDLRPETRSYGAAQMITPNLDQLAADGYQFNRAYVQQAVCGPSRASVMSGLRPDSTLVYKFNGDFRVSIPWVYTLPQVLSQQGYHSVGIGKIYHGGTNDELSWDEPWSAGSGTYGSTGNAAYENAAVPDSSLRDGAVTDTAIGKLAQLKNQQPFFYGVGYVRPHLPFVAPSAYWDLYTVDDLELPYTDSPAIGAPSYSYTTWGELRNYSGIPSSGPVSAEQEQNLIHGYYACVSFVDAQVGRLMDALEAQGLAENTIVIVWGDHGWHLGDHGQWCKHTNFERATRIPLIIKVPWMPGASQVDALVEALDIYPTLLDLCGIEHPDHIQGQSLLPLLQNPEAAGPAEAVSQYPRNNESIMGYSMRTDRYRYVEWRSAGSDTPVATELYDHFFDPGEDTNVVSSADGALLAALSSQLDPYIDEAYRAPGGVIAESFTSVLTDAGLTGADALAYADADGDGVNNLYEFAYNMNLAVSDYHVLDPGAGTSGLPTYQLAETNGFTRLDLEYLRRIGAEEVEYIPEFTGNLVDGVWTSPVAGGTAAPIDSEWERVTAGDLESTATASNRFGRVRVLLKP